MATKAQITAEHRQYAKRSVAHYNTEVAVENAKAALVLTLLQFVARDIWGSADLHFDGDCFQEHEWHVIMRGGTFGDMHRSHASGKTALTATLAAAELKLKESTGHMSKKDQQQHWSQIDLWRCIAEALEARLPIVRKMENDARTAPFKENLVPDKPVKPLTREKK
jgi:hypothetical protein